MPLIAGALLANGALGCAPDVAQRGAQHTTARGAQLASKRHPSSSDAEDIERKVQRLKTQLALSEAEVRELRERLSIKSYRRQTVRIGESTRGDLQDDWLSSNESGGARPILRLHGPSLSASTAPQETRASSAQTWELAQRLPALPVSDKKPAPVFTAIAGTASSVSVPESTVGTPIARYRAALVLLRDRKFGSAVRALDRFIIDHAAHPYADNALYWKGEALYAQRQYRESIRAFELLLRSYKRSGKRADALLKIGMSHERLGETELAYRRYGQLQKNFPNSVAAKRAPRRN